MATDLVELVKGYLTPDVIQRASGQVGESSGATQKALAGIVPTLLAGLTNMGSTPDGRSSWCACWMLGSTTAVDSRT